jgi:hypothetical protein
MHCLQHDWRPDFAALLMPKAVIGLVSPQPVQHCT